MLLGLLIHYLETTLVINDLASLQGQCKNKFESYIDIWKRKNFFNTIGTISFSHL